MTTVLASTDQLPVLVDALAQRHAQGLDMFDEWWDGVYRVVTGPTPHHGEIVIDLGAFLKQLARPEGLRVAAPLNIGVDKQDARVPDIGVFRPDTPYTSPAFLTTAELVVEILSPGEQPGAKLDFYARWQVGEYLEVDPAEGTGRLLRRDGDRWSPTDTSAVLGFTVEAHAVVAGDRRVDLLPHTD